MTPAEQAGILSSQGYFQQIDSPANKTFTAAFAEKFGADKPINYIGASVYQTAMLYAKAVEKAGSVEPEKVVEAISQVEVDGPIGTMRVEAETHHAVLPNYLARVNDSAKLEILKSYEPKPPVAGCKL